MEAAEFHNKCRELRKTILKQITKSKSSHIGSMLSCIELAAYLYYKEMNFSKNSLADPERDRFILSKGHASLVVYAILEDLGIISSKERESYYGDDTYLIGHLNYKVPGVGISTGSLGHGLSIAAGIALGNKLNSSSSRTFCLIGDGETDEGSIWEALMFISRHALKNLAIIVDVNKLQGYPVVSISEKHKSLRKMLKSLDLDFYEIEGHSFEEIESVFEKIRESKTGNASIIFAHTVKGKGISFMEGKLEWHYKSPDENQLRKALDELR